MPIYHQLFDFSCLASIVISLPVANTKEETKESATNESSRDKLRLRCGGYLVGIAVALSCLWQDCNREGVDHRYTL
jgi:hypothetical protein